uniref:Uncharacterized protein n=1 Tax=Arundo donax TaxID=35708 RepID=A0A0A8Z0V6_ARUDO
MNYRELQIYGQTIKIVEKKSKNIFSEISDKKMT